MFVIFYASGRPQDEPAGPHGPASLLRRGDRRPAGPRALLACPFDPGESLISDVQGGGMFAQKGRYEGPVSAKVFFNFPSSKSVASRGQQAGRGKGEVRKYPDVYSVVILLFFCSSYFSKRGTDFLTYQSTWVTFFLGEGRGAIQKISGPNRSCEGSVPKALDTRNLINFFFCTGRTGFFSGGGRGGGEPGTPSLLGPGGGGWVPDPPSIPLILYGKEGGDRPPLLLFSTHKKRSRWWIPSPRVEIPSRPPCLTSSSSHLPDRMSVRQGPGSTARTSSCSSPPSCSSSSSSSPPPPTGALGTLFFNRQSQSYESIF